VIVHLFSLDRNDQRDEVIFDASAGARRNILMLINKLNIPPLNFNREEEIIIKADLGFYEKYEKHYLFLNPPSRSREHVGVLFGEVPSYHDVHFPKDRVIKYYSSSSGGGHYIILVCPPETLIHFEGYRGRRDFGLKFTREGWISVPEIKLLNPEDIQGLGDYVFEPSYVYEGSETPRICNNGYYLYLPVIAENMDLSKSIKIAESGHSLFPGESIYFKKEEKVFSRIF